MVTIRRILGIIGVVLASAVSAAGSTVAAPITTKQAAAQYLADVVPLQNATNRFSAAFDSWAAAGGAPAQTKVFVKPMVAAEEAFGQLLLRQHWPTNDLTAVRRRVTAQASVVADLERLPTIKGSSVGEWITTFTSDDAARAEAANVVRSDLGLPPLTA